MRARLLCVFTCLCAHVLGVLTCLVCLRVSVLTCMACLRAWRAYVFACLRTWRVYVLTCLVCLRVYVRACYDEMFYFLTCLCTWRVSSSYLLCISILKFKNYHSKKLCALLSWTYFLFTFWYQLKQYQFFTIYIFTYYINFCWTHCFCLIYCQSSYWLLLLLDNIPW